MGKRTAGSLALVSALSCFIAGCDNAVIEDVMVPPPAIALLITVTNRADAAAAVKIRHARIFDGCDTSKTWSYSSWNEPVSVEPGGVQRLAPETVRYQYKNEEREMSGFILWEEAATGQFTHLAGTSSFDLELTMGGRTIRLAGYETEAPGFDGAGLGWLYAVHR